MPPLTIVPDLSELNQLAVSDRTQVEHAATSSSFISVANKLSTSALSKQLAT